MHCLVICKTERGVEARLMNPESAKFKENIKNMCDAAKADMSNNDVANALHDIAKTIAEAAKTGNGGYMRKGTVMNAVLFAACNKDYRPENYKNKFRTVDEWLEFYEKMYVAQNADIL